MWVFHTSCIFLINIYDDDVYTTAYTPIYSIPFYGTDPHLWMWAVFSECRFRWSVLGSIVILWACCSTSSIVVIPHVPRTWCLMLVSWNCLHLITEYESVRACLNGLLVLLIFLEACHTSVDVGSWLISRILLSFWNSFILGWWLLCWYLRVIYENPIDLYWTE